MSGFLAQNDSVDGVVYEYADGFRGGLRAYQEAGKSPDVVVALRTDEQGLFCDWEKVNDPNFKIFFASGHNFQSGIALTAAMMKKAGTGRAGGGRRALQLPRGPEGHVQSRPAAGRLGLDPRRRRHAEGDVRAVGATSGTKDGRGTDPRARSGVHCEAWSKDLTWPAPSLKLTGISKSYPGVQALADVGFECLPGEIHAVLGENGSGKSTLLGIASGAVVPDSGTVEIMGEPLTDADPQLARRLGLATVYQDNSLVRELTVAENLVLAAGDGRDGRCRAPSPSASSRRTTSTSRPTRSVGDLTAAERQFLEIVKALIGSPKVLLLDEPTSSARSRRRREAERHHPPDHRRRHRGRLCQPPAAGDSRPRRPRHDPPRRRRPGHLRGRRAASPRTI